jgi:hypothetical protein
MSNLKMPTYVMSPLKSADSIKSRFKKRMQQKSTPYENVF